MRVGHCHSGRRLLIDPHSKRCTAAAVGRLQQRQDQHQNHGTRTVPPGTRTEAISSETSPPDRLLSLSSTLCSLLFRLFFPPHSQLMLFAVTLVPLFPGTLSQLFLVHICIKASHSRVHEATLRTRQRRSLALPDSLSFCGGASAPR